MKCFNCGSENVVENIESPEDKPYVIRHEFDCRDCLNCWWEDEE
jgi:hypothetical protein